MIENMMAGEKNSTEGMTKDQIKQFGTRDMMYRAEDDVRTLMSAAKIQRDKKRMKMAGYCAECMRGEMQHAFHGGQEDADS